MSSSESDYRRSNSGGQGNRTLMIALIVVVLVVGLPAIGIGAVLLGRSSNEGVISSGPVQSAESTIAPTTVERPSTTKPSPSTTAPVDDPAADMSDASTAPRTAESNSSATSLLKDVRVAHHEGYDRTVFEFDGAVPGFQIEYVDGLYQDGSGDPVKIKGDVLQVIIRPASGVEFDQSGGFTKIYKGPNRISGPGGAINEVVSAGDFEGQITWGLGVTGRKPFKVSTLEKPSRVVVDVANRP